MDQTLVALDIAWTGVKGAAALVNTLNDLNDRYEQGSTAGINLTDYDPEIEGRGATQHTNGQNLNRLFATVVPDVIAYLKATEFEPGETYWDILQKCRGYEQNLSGL
jgi:hypothetical protein